MNIKNIDSNFKLESHIEKDDIKFLNVLKPPFKIYGLINDGNKGFFRMPDEVACAANDGVNSLNRCTSGGRIRFKTNSSYVAINTKTTGIGVMSQFSVTGSDGFDMYEKRNGRYNLVGTFIPPWSTEEVTQYESVIDFKTDGMHEVTINLPLYGMVYEIYVGLQNGSVIEEPEEYSIEKPVVFYGSSITQGACATRPGMCYVNMLSRWFDMNFTNLGLSGHAMAEEPIVQYIKGLDMTMFVYDYDYNAPDVEYLEKTHKPMFEAIRNANPDLPIIMLSAPKYFVEGTEWEKRREVVYKTYQDAKNAGDENVYFLSGFDMLDKLGLDETIVDEAHPTDLGFYSMADSISKIMEKILNKKIVK